VGVVDGFSGAGDGTGLGFGILGILNWADVICTLQTVSSKAATMTKVLLIFALLLF
jgi:hypothetical protein